MHTSTIIDRFRVYTKSVSLLLAAVAAGIILLFSFADFNDDLAIIGVVWIGLALVGFPFYISKKLDLFARPFLFAIPVAIACLGLLALKVVVNESAFRSCLDSPPFMLNYLWFYCWSSVLLWEVYVIIITRIRSRPISSRIIFILPLLSITSFYSCKSDTNPDSTGLSRKVSRLAHEIATDNVLAGSKVGSGGRRPRQWNNFERLSEIATDKELTMLTDYSNAVVRCYAFEAILKRKHIDYFPILLRHLSDTTTLRTFSYCISSRKKAGDIFLEEATSLSSLSADQKSIVDSILLFDKGSRLSARTDLLDTLPKEDRYYTRLKELVAVEQNIEALPALAKFQKKEDKQFIEQLLKQDDDNSQNYGLAAIVNFPDPVFFSFLKQVAEKELQNENRNIDWRLVLTLYQAIVQYKDQSSRALLDFALKQSEGEAFLTRADLIHQALKKYPDPIYDGLLDPVNKLLYQLKP